MTQEVITINLWLLSVLQAFLDLFFSDSNTSSILHSLKYYVII